MGRLVYEKPRLVNEVDVSLLDVFSQAVVWGCITERKKSSFSTFFCVTWNIKSRGNCWKEYF